MTGELLADFHVVGVPMPQGSKRAFVVKGRAVLTDVKGKELKAWRALVGECASAVFAEAEPVDGPLEVHARFAFERPKTVTRVWPFRRPVPDVDKLARALLDGLTRAVFKDDAQVVRLHVEKVYAGQPGAWVRVFRLEGEQ